VKYAWIKSHQNEFTVAAMYQFLNVSRSCFYDWLKRPKTEREKEDEVLTGHLKDLFQEGRGNYGTRRLKRRLADLGYPVSRRRIGRLLKHAGLICKTKRKFKVTTDSKLHHPIAPNRLERQFNVAKPNQVFVGDITYIGTQEGWLYLAAERASSWITMRATKTIARQQCANKPFNTLLHWMRWSKSRSGSAFWNSNITWNPRIFFTNTARGCLRTMLFLSNGRTITVITCTLRTKLKRLIHNEPRLAERLEIHAMDAIGQRLFELHFGKANLAPKAVVEKLIEDAAKSAGGHRFSPNFLLTEWMQVVDMWQLESFEAYRDVKRLGRKTRLPEPQRRTLWSIFDKVRVGLNNRGLVTRAEMFTRLAGRLAESGHPPFDFAVVDEAQDIDAAQLRFLAALGANRPNSLFFAGDLGQRIFQQAFSWAALGVDIRGRSRTLKVNYRTSHQIRMQADLLLGSELADVDGNIEERRGTISVFNGPSPMILALDTLEAEIETVSDWLKARLSDGIVPREIGVFVRSADELARAEEAARNAALPFKVLDERVETTGGHAAICTMHLAKGLEFRAVAVMACDDEIIPSQARIEAVSEDSDLKEVYDTERHLLYVACTRARDHLLVTSGDVHSEFLDDLRS
jgi:UvrD-like helicase C-terminal domain/HTH-like domain/UvrD/REP helicase N-terminal domain